MAYETDEARDAARQRLQARMERRGTPQPANSTKRVSAKSKDQQTTRVSVETLNVKTPLQGAATAIPSIPPIAVVAAGIMIALAFGVIAITQCARIAPADATELIADDGAQTPIATIDKNNGAQRKLIDLIGEDSAKLLLRAAGTDADALWIAAHPDEFAFDGPEVQAKILSLAANEPEAIPFVRDFPAKYPMSKPDSSATSMSGASPSNEIPATKVPHLYQWDQRWGYTTYSSAAFGLTGCGPTTMAMVVQALTDEKTTPYEMGKFIDEQGFMDKFNGTGSEFFTSAADELGLDCTQLYPTDDSITEALATGAVVVANMGPGQFSETGHYIVLAGLDGWNVVVNDPYSVERSSHTWDPEKIADEAITLFAFTKIDK